MVNLIINYSIKFHKTFVPLNEVLYAVFNRYMRFKANHIIQCFGLGAGLHNIAWLDLQHIFSAVVPNAFSSTMM